MKFVGVWLVVLMAFCSGESSSSELKIVISFPTGEPTTYTSCSTRDEIDEFAFDCMRSSQIQITPAPTSSSSSSTLSTSEEQPVSASYDQAVTRLLQIIAGSQSVETTLPEQQKRHLALVCWYGYKGFSSLSPSTSQIFYSNFEKIAPTNFEKARLILLSQCVLPSDSSSEGSTPDYTPRSDADWTVIGDAIHVLRHENNGQKSEADALLRLLKGIKKSSGEGDEYGPLLGDWEG